MKPHNNKATENNSTTNNHNKIPNTTTKRFPFRKYRRLVKEGKNLECLDILIDFLPTPTKTQEDTIKHKENTRE